MKLLLILVTLFSTTNNNFLENQKKFSRVRNAISEKLESAQKLFEDKNIEFPPRAIFIRVFKSEKIVELWAHGSKTDTFHIIKSYTFCSSSGTLGPKRKQGDNQIPEGFYYIDRFNPSSNFHLSLGINYPNKLDRELGNVGSLGGDIFIHGNCVTIGCIPITDDLIKELYLIAIYTKDHGQQKIPIHIFPIRLTKTNLKRINDFFHDKHFEFWENLKEGFEYFETRHQIPSVTVTSKKYLFR